MDKKLKQNLFLVLSGVALFACLINFDVILNMAGKALTLFFPIISGFLIAFVLNVPMSGFTLFLSKIFKKDKPKHKKAIKLLSLLLTYASILTVIVIIFTLIVPTTAKSLSSLYNTILIELPKLTERLMEYDIDISQITEYVQSLDVNKIIENVFSGAGTLFSSVAGFLSTTVSVVANTFIAIIISVYVLSYKERLKIQTNRFMKAFLKEPLRLFIIKIAKKTNECFTKFLSGQCVEAIILSGLISITFLIFRIPYAGLMGLLSGILSFIPFIGPFIACFAGSFFVLLAEPSKFILSIVVYLVVQYVEEQFIYPHVVGGSVGLAPLWTLVAVLIGGELFGALGIFFSIPITAVIFQLLKEKMNKKLLSFEKANQAEETNITVQSVEIVKPTKTEEIEAKTKIKSSEKTIKNQKTKNNKTVKANETKE